MKATVARSSPVVVEGRRTWTIPGKLATLFAVAFLFRAMFVLYVALHSDALDRLHSFNEAVRIARALSTQHAFVTPFHGASGPTAWIAPVYPLLLAGIFDIVGVETKASFVAAAILNSLFAALTAVMIYKIGARQFEESAGMLAAWGWALCPYLLLLVGLMWEAVLSALILSCAIYLTLKTVSSQKPRDAILCGAAWGLQALTSPAMLTVVPFWLVYLWWRTRRVLPAATVAVTLLVVVTPWCVRNQLALHDGFLLRSNGWAEVYFANISNASHPTQPTSEYQALGEIEFSRLMRYRVVHYIEDHPAKFVLDSGRRFLRLWIVPARYWSYTVFMVLMTVAGLVVGVRRYGERVVPLVGVLLLCPAIYYFCFTFARYRHPVEPMMFLFAGVAVTELRTHIARPDRAA